MHFGCLLVFQKTTCLSDRFVGFCSLLMTSLNCTFFALHTCNYFKITTKTCKIQIQHFETTSNIVSASLYSIIWPWNLLSVNCPFSYCDVILWKVCTLKHILIAWFGLHCGGVYRLNYKNCVFVPNITEGLYLLPSFIWCPNWNNIDGITMQSSVFSNFGSAPVSSNPINFVQAEVY